jgi:hypothetical protein
MYHFVRKTDWDLDLNILNLKLLKRALRLKIFKQEVSIFKQY